MKKQLVLTGLLAICTSISAQPWQMVGPRAMGMGGAGVAVATGAEAQYWNPAALAVDNELDKNLIIGLGAQMETTKNVANAIDSLNDLSNQYKSVSNTIKTGGAPTATDLTTIFKGLGDISKLTKQGTGIVAGADAGIGTKFKHFAVSVRSLGTIGVTPVVDAKNVGFSNQGGQTGLTISAGAATDVAAVTQVANAINATGTLAALNTLLGTIYATANAMANDLVFTAETQPGATAAQVSAMAQAVAENLPQAAGLINTAGAAGGGTGYSNNESRVMADAGAFTEAALGYGYQFLPGLQVGGNFKVIEGTLTQTGILVLSDDKDFGDIISDANKNKKNSTNVGIDLGARLSLAELLDREIWGKPTLGITARNVNAPKFKRPGVPTGLNAVLAQNWNTSDYKLKPQVRAGAALEIFKILTVAADMDLTENDTNVVDYHSRQLALGAELDLTKGKKWGLPIRAGINKNIAESDSEMYYTAGIGLRLARFWLELAGAVSGETAKVDGQSIPTSAAASLQFGFVF